MGKWIFTLNTYSCVQPFIYRYKQMCGHMFNNNKNVGYYFVFLVGTNILCLSLTILFNMNCFKGISEIDHGNKNILVAIVDCNHCWRELNQEFPIKKTEILNQFFTWIASLLDDGFFLSMNFYQVHLIKTFHLLKK